MTEMPLPQDGRNFWMLPQGPEDGGYYNYGTPLDGASQYCHPNLIELIFTVGYKWAQLDGRRFGVGNVSLAEGIKHKDHQTHRDGLQVDVRALRKDGRNLPVTYRDTNYDAEATAKLIKFFFDSSFVRNINFNDLSIPRVKHLANHDNHFHVDVR